MRGVNKHTSEGDNNHDDFLTNEKDVEAFSTKRLNLLIKEARNEINSFKDNKSGDASVKENTKKEINPYKEIQNAEHQYGLGNYGISVNSYRIAGNQFAANGEGGKESDLLHPKFMALEKIEKNENNLSLKAARALIKRGEFSEAIEFLNEIITESEENERLCEKALYLKAGSLCHTGEIEKGLECYDNLITKNNKDIKAIKRKKYKLEKEGAENKIIDYQNLSSSEKKLRQKELIEISKKEEVICEQHRELIRKNKKNAEILFQKGCWLKKDNKTTEAIKAWEKSIKAGIGGIVKGEHSDDAIESLIKIGLHYEETGETSKAINVWKTGIELGLKKSYFEKKNKEAKKGKENSTPSKKIKSEVLKLISFLLNN